jgi:hypothetical protein
VLYSTLSRGATSFSLEVELEVDFVVLDEDEDGFLMSSSFGFDDDDEVSLLLLLSRECEVSLGGLPLTLSWRINALLVNRLEVCRSGAGFFSSGFASSVLSFNSDIKSLFFEGPPSTAVDGVFSN